MGRAKLFPIHRFGWAEEDGPDVVGGAVFDTYQKGVEGKNTWRVAGMFRLGSSIFRYFPNMV
jgi:hypothetical protein